MVANIRRQYPIYLFLIVITLVVYSRVSDCGFTHYDDNIYVTDNANVKSGVTFDNIKWAFAGKFESNWMPLTWISFMIDHEIAAATASSLDYDQGSENPSIYHLTNLILHTLNVLLLFVVLNAFTGYRWRSAFVAALFAVHPLHVESVAWIAERKDVLSTFFWLTTMLAYLYYTASPNIKRYLLVTLSFILGLMSKSMLVTLPFVLLLLDYWPLKRTGVVGGESVPDRSPTDSAPTKGRVPSLHLSFISHNPSLSPSSTLPEKLPLLALAAAAGVIALFAQRRGGATTMLTGLSLGERVANAIYSCIAYVWKTIWPANLAVSYPHPRNTLPIAVVVGCTIIFAVISVLAVRLARRRPYIAVGWFWYVITLLPVLGIVQIGRQGMADRYTYIPSIGLFIILAWGVPDLLARIPDKARAIGLSTAAGLIICCLMFRAYSQVGYWKDDLTLFGHAVAVSRNSADAEFNLATTYAASGQIDRAIPYYRRTLRIDPRRDDAYNSLGGIFLMQGKVSEARGYLEEAVRLKPDNINARSNLSIIFMQEGKFSEAIRELKMALKYQPNNDDLRQSLRDAEEIRKASE